MYYEDGEIDLPTIKDEIGNAGYDGVTGLASFNSSQFSISSDGTVTIIGGSTGLDTAQLKTYLDSNKYTTETWVKEQGYASASSLSSLQNRVNDFLEGSDTDTIINKWKELELFLEGLTESDNLAEILTSKASLDYVNSTFVTIAGNEDVTGLHNFVNGLKVGGIELIQKNGNAFLKGNLVVEGGITMYGDGEGGSSVPLYSTLGSLLNVDESNDAVASVDRVLFQSAGSNVWSWKALSEIGGGSSGGGSVSGDYLPLSGGTIASPNVPLMIQRTTANFALIGYKSATSDLGYLGFTTDGNLVVSPNRQSGNTTYYDVIHSGNISSYNAGSATKLQTARTIWGQSFDGTGNIVEMLLSKKYTLKTPI